MMVVYRIQITVLLVGGEQRLVLTKIHIRSVNTRVHVFRRFLESTSKHVYQVVILQSSKIPQLPYIKKSTSINPNAL